MLALQKLGAHSTVQESDDETAAGEKLALVEDE